MWNVDSLKMAQAELNGLLPATLLHRRRKPGSHSVSAHARGGSGDKAARPSKAPHHLVSDALRAEINARNALDASLYAYIRRRFDQVRA